MPPKGTHAYYFLKSSHGECGELYVSHAGMCAVFESEIMSFPFAGVSDVCYDFAACRLSFMHACTAFSFIFAQGFAAMPLLRALKLGVRARSKVAPSNEFSPLKMLTDNGTVLDLPEPVHPAENPLLERLQVIVQTLLAYSTRYSAEAAAVAQMRLLLCLKAKLEQKMATIDAVAHIVRQIVMDLPGTRAELESLLSMCYKAWASVYDSIK